MKLTIITLLFLLLTSCIEKDKKYEIGKYVYVDCFNTIHTDRECASVLAENPKTKDERIANMQGIQFVDTCKLVHNPSWTYKFCSKCVDDDAYNRISAMMDRNEIKPLAY